MRFGPVCGPRVCPEKSTENTDISMEVRVDANLVSSACC